MREIWGLIPAAGKATRLRRDPQGHLRKGPSKEILSLPLAERRPPPGARRASPARTCSTTSASPASRAPSSCCARANGTFRNGSATAASSASTSPTASSARSEASRGVPFTLAAAAPFLGDRMAALGFPDLLVQPRDLLARLVRHREQNQSDLALALVPCDRPQSSDLVELSPRGKVRRIEIKPESTTLKWTWAFAVWTPRFTPLPAASGPTGFNARSRRLGREPHAADVFIGALGEGFEIDALPEPSGRVLDIGTPETLAAAAGFHPSS